MTNRPFRMLAVLAIGIAAGFGGSLAAQGTTTAPDVLTALLVEVRGLRAAMEQMASAGPRIELALGRLQLQEQRVNNLLRQHAEVRERLAGVENRAAGALHEIERLQDVVRDSPDERARERAQFELSQMKKGQALLNVDLQRLRAEEADVAQLLSQEQGRWMEINLRLEELERALTRK